MTQPDILRLLMILFSAIGIWVWVTFAKQHPVSWLFAVAPIAILAHFIVFYVYVFITGLENTDSLFVTWRLGIGLQSVITFILIGLHASVEFKAYGK
jgi:Kef-type K+ transport system membrane component KefB